MSRRHGNFWTIRKARLFYYFYVYSVDDLLPGEKPHNHPDIVSRVFVLKLETLMEDIRKGLFGPVLCYVYTIEFQKRELPHVLIFVTIQNGHK